MKLNVIITGVTGMVGEGILYACLDSNKVEKILIISRKPSLINHPKVKEIIHADFNNFDSFSENISEYNACFHCLGVSSVGMKEEQFNKLTFELTKAMVDCFSSLNPKIAYTYVSGVGTDGSEKGKSIWARVKGKTENYIRSIPNQGAFMFRPGYLQPTKGTKNAYKTYKILSFLYPVLKFCFPKYTCTLEEMGKAMINVCAMGYSKNVLEVEDIKKAALLR
jgi:nucleoside-diphosphate-sugar epimerase